MPPRDLVVRLGQTTDVGRLPTAAIRLSDPQVSRRHLEVQLTPRGWLVRDLGATNPAEVDRGTGYRSLRSEETLDQCRLRIGATVLTLHPADALLSGADPLSSRARRRSALAALGVGTVGAVAILVLTFATLTTSSGSHESDALVQSVEEQDAGAFLAALGATAPGEELLKAVSDEFSQRPELRLEVVSSDVLSEAEGERTEERVYRVTEPGAPTRRLTFEVRSREDPGTGTWTAVAMIPIAEAIE